MRQLLLCVVAALILSPRALDAEDWPMLGRDATRNAVSPEKKPPLFWKTAAPGVNVRWSAELGISCYSTPVVYRGTVWAGTALGRQDGENKPGGALRCYRESDGKLLYERVSASLPVRVNKPEWLGIGSSPLIEGERLWYVTNRWEVVCLDIGPILARGEAARELWVVDMPKEFGVTPYAASNGPARHCSIAARGERIFVGTGNGVGQNRVQGAAPGSPALVCLDKSSGGTLWTDKSPGRNVLYGEAASPLVAEIDGRVQVIMPQGDAWLRSFDPQQGSLLWEFDLNAKESQLALGGRGTRNYSLAAPVLYDGRIYVTTGQEPVHGEGPGRVVCIDPTKTGDISEELAVDQEGRLLPPRRIQNVVAEDGEHARPNPNSGLLWQFDVFQAKFEEQMHRSVSSAVVADKLAIVTDFSGMLHCLDAWTGKRHWSYDLLAACWSTPLVVDGFIYCADEDGDIAILRLSADPNIAMPAGKPVAEINMNEAVYTSPIFANGTLYVAAQQHLYAISEPP